MADLASILQQHNLRKTKFRIELLQLFSETTSSLTAEEIKKRVGKTNDKVTIYRALDAFEKSGLIHKVPDKSNLTRYAMCHTNCSAHAHIDNHAHFICTECNETFCMDEIEVPKMKQHGDFQIKTSNLTLEGNCPKCI